MGTRTARRIDWTFLAAAALAMTTFVLGIVFYWRPAAEEELNPRWWQWAVTAVIFFAAVGVAYHRHRSRGRAALHAALADERATLEAAQDGPTQSSRVDGVPDPGSPNRSHRRPDAPRYRSITNEPPQGDGTVADGGGKSSPEGRESGGASDGRG